MMKRAHSARVKQYPYDAIVDYKPHHWAEEKKLEYQMNDN